MTREQLARLCGWVFLGSLIPLYLIALYNYPADDDFAFTLPAATAWVNTGSLWATLQAVVQKTVETYQSWQGDFVSTAFFGLCPMVFDIDLYFISSWFILTLLWVSVGYLVKEVTHHYLKAERSVFLITYAAVMVLVLQFMPSIGYSVFWHNGGQYTVAACTLMLTVGLLLRCNAPMTRGRSLFRGGMLALCGLMLGGSFYGPALGAIVLLSLVTLFGWIKKAPFRWHGLIACVFFAGAFAISAAAPGVDVRQGLNGDPLGLAQTLVTTTLDSFDLAGGWLSPQLLAMLMLIVPVMWKPLRESDHAFRQPFWVFVALYGLFAATLAPGIYTKAGYDTPRYMNAIYFYFLITTVGSVLYAQGAIIRYLERHMQRESQGRWLQVSQGLGERFSVVYLLLCVGLLAMGGFGYTIMNTASISATRSLVTGEAQQWRLEMAERQEYIRVTDSDVVEVRSLSVQPAVFKGDRLPFQGIYGRVRYMKWYFELFYNAEHGVPPQGN